jgi:threonine/homoserine/homoserine lactone efflux protein
LLLVLFVAGLPRLVDIEALLRPASAVGAALMAYFAYGTARASEASGAPRRHTFWGVFALSATNPFQLAWWASGGTALLAERGLWGAAGFLVAIYFWVFLLANLVARGAGRWNWFQPAVQVLSADLLLVFALVLTGQALGPL